jgi:PTS system nitrogen regulatory IIA component
MSDLKNDSLAQLITRGGIYYDVGGNDRAEFMSDFIGRLTALPPEKKQALFQAVMEREALMSTGMEKGIALPHPRTPMLEDGEKPFAAIAFPLSPLAWDTPDNSKVHTVFLIVSKSPKQHLGVLSGINVLCRDEDFFPLLSKQAEKDKIIAAIEEAEKNWGER